MKKMQILKRDLQYIFFLLLFFFLDLFIVKIGEKKAGGLGEFEVGSTNYITEGFAFGYDDGEECDETTEEDLIYLNDPITNYNTAVKNILFFIVYFNTTPI